MKMLFSRASTTRYAFLNFPLLFPSSSLFRSFPYSLPLNQRIHSHHHPPNPDLILNDVHSFINRLLLMRPPPSITQINKLLAAIAKKEHYPTAISLWTRARSRGFTPCTVTLNILINCYCHMGQMAFAFSLLGKILKNGNPNVVTYNALMDGYCLMHNVIEAIQVFIKMVKCGLSPDVTSYNILIYGLCQIEHVDEAIDLFREMLRKKLVPNDVTFYFLLDGLGKCQRIQDIIFKMRPDLSTSLDEFYVDEGVALYMQIEEQDIQANLCYYNLFIDGLYNIGRLSTAQEIFQHLLINGPCPDVWTYAFMMHGLCKGGLFEEAISLFYKMKQNGVHPNLDTFNILYHALLKINKNDEAKKVVDEVISGGLLEK